MMQQGQKQLIRADFSYYPTMSSDDGKFLISSGYVYQQMIDQNGKPRLNFGRPMYQRLHLNQTLPFQLPPMETHEEVRDFLHDEARRMLEELSSGKLKPELSFRFRNCLYDDHGIFFEMLQGGARQVYVSKEESQSNPVPVTEQEWSDFHKSSNIAVDADDFLDWVDTVHLPAQ